MKTLDQEINEFVTNRILDVYSRINTSGIYCKRSREIGDMYDKIVKDISPELKEEIDEYIETRSLRYGLVEEEIYRQGFKDGMEFSGEAGKIE